MTLEETARRSWQRWGSAWCMTTRCHDCGEVTVCRGRTKRRLLCLHCWDQQR